MENPEQDKLTEHNTDHENTNIESQDAAASTADEQASPGPSGPELEQKIVDYVNRPNYHPVKPRVIAKKLGLTQDQPSDFKRVVKRLIRQGRIAYAANHLICPVAPPTSPTQGEASEGHASPTVRAEGKNSTRITGVFRRTPAGFGFVRPSGSLPGADKRMDVFIPAKRAADAASGDTVVVRLTKKRETRRPNPEGEIVSVAERQTSQFVGTYYEELGSAYVRVDGKTFSTPILVGDPGAKNAVEGDKVVFEMVRFPSHVHDGEGVITERLGPAGQPGVDTLSIIREFNLPGEFPEDVLEDARRQADAFDDTHADFLQGRLDLTGETIITIDPVDARDFDDAISIQRLPNGHWRLGVHIADVAHFVQPGTPLDREAYDRATSVYLPDRVIPMLPEIISNGLASLQPDKVRFTKTCFIEFTAEGVPVGTDAANSAIRSVRRFTYEEVDDYLADRESWRGRITPQVFQLLADMHELAMMLRERRIRHGALELAMREVKIDLDKNGRVSGAHVVQNTESHQMIEECMLAANEAIARLLYDHKLHFLRRVHSDPSPLKLKALNEFVAQFGFKLESLESRFELQRLLTMVRGRPEEHAVHYAVLRSFQRAVYSPVEEGHYALASDCYCHFTSPIRRYPDLTVHRLLWAVLTKQKPVNDFNALAMVGEHCSERERRAEDAERELTKVKLLNYLADRIGEEFEAVITGVEEFGLFAQGVQIPAEGLIHVTSLSDDFYRYDRTTHTLAGHRAGNSFRLGDIVQVSVARVDVDRRELDFRMVERLARPKRVPLSKAEHGPRRKKRDDKSDDKPRNRKPTEGHKRKQQDG